jgi:3'(2'), 5'-bisphosphate nucleotidase
LNDREAQAELEEILAIAREAEAVVRAVYETRFAVEMKGPNDPVTRADREANALICERLAKSFPGDAVVAEESVPEDEDEIRALLAKERVFFVDPLDGTREFADHRPEFAVMIGLAVRGRATLGVLVLPPTGEALCGRTDTASPIAFREERGGARLPMKPSAKTDPAEATLMVSRSHRPPLIEPLAERLHVRAIVPCGSVGVKVAHVIQGSGDVYVHAGTGAKLWDTCGPEAVLLAAGGRFTDTDGHRIDYGRDDLRLPNGLVATNGPLHDEVLAAIRALREGAR